MATAKKKPGTAVAKWDEELARQAQIAAGMEESTASGRFFGLEGGILTWNDAPIEGNQMAVVILDAVLENVYYDGPYIKGEPQSPHCFAHGRDENTMGPHKSVVEAGQAMAPQCKGCEMNEFGTANVGRGKACRNTRRLAMIPAGHLTAAGKLELIDDAEHYESTQIGFMKLPVTSIKGYAAFVKQVAGALKRPPHGIVTKVKVVPDPKSQFKVIFEPLTQLPDELMGAIMTRHEEAKSVIEFPYQLAEEEEQPQRRKPATKKKTAARGRKY